MITKKETLTQNITYMAIMAGVNAVFSLIAAFFPILSFFLMIVLPLTSTIVFLFAKHKYYIIYAITTVALCLLVTMWDMSFTIFYIVPSILTGYLFGLFIQYKIQPIWTIFITTIAQALFFALTIPLINFVFEVDVIQTFFKAFLLNESLHVFHIIPSFLFLMALIQMSFSYLIISFEIDKFGYSINTSEININLFSILNLIFIIFIIPFVFIYPSASYLFLMISFYFAFYLIFNSKSFKKYFLLIIYLILGFLFIFLFALLYPLINAPFGLLILGLIPLFITTTTFINNLLLKKSYKDKMNKNMKGEESA